MRGVPAMAHTIISVLETRRLPQGVTACFFRGKMKKDYPFGVVCSIMYMNLFAERFILSYFAICECAEDFRSFFSDFGYFVRDEIICGKTETPRHQSDSIKQSFAVKLVRIK